MKYLIVFLLMGLSVSAKPYFSTKDYEFDVTYTNADGPSEIGLYTVNNAKEGKLDSVQWVHIGYRIIYLDQTYCVQNVDYIRINSPSRGAFQEADFVPYPQVNLPLAIGDSIYTEQVNSNGKLQKGYLKIIDELIYGKNSKNNKVWKIEAINIENPDYSAVYYYNEENGFVYFSYNLGQKKIEMNIKSIEYNEF